MTPAGEKLPLVISVPHAGLQIPPEVAPENLLTPEEIEQDGDEGARQIYDFPDQVQRFVTTEIARAFVDMNRAADDRRQDGVVKTHTCWEVPIYRKPLSQPLVQNLLQLYYHPYHQNLGDAARAGGVVLGIDCHTMASVGPPVGPDHGQRRPQVCLSHGNGTCLAEWFEGLVECFSTVFDEVKRNDPFTGGFITRSKPGGIPWVQLELSRASYVDSTEKRSRVLEALRRWSAHFA